MSNQTEQRAEMIKKINGVDDYLNTTDDLLEKIKKTMNDFEGDLEARRSMIYTLDSMSESLEEIGLLIGKSEDKVIDTVEEASEEENEAMRLLQQSTDNEG